MNNLHNHAQDLRKGRYSEPNRLYLVTAVTLNRNPVFQDFQHARVLINILRSEHLRNQVNTYAYVVMPDHFHWLLQLNEEALSHVVGRVKRLTARQLGQNLWQDGFHDRAVRQEDDLKAMARYVIANPLRAGLVESIGDYPHWDAVWV